MILFPFMFDFRLFFKVFQKWPWSNPGVVCIDFVNVCIGFQCFFVFPVGFSIDFHNFSNTGARLHFGPKRRGSLGQPRPFCSGSFNRVRIHRRVPMVAQSFWLGVLRWCPHSRESRCESRRESRRESPREPRARESHESP